MINRLNIHKYALKCILVFIFSSCFFINSYAENKKIINKNRVINIIRKTKSSRSIADKVYLDLETSLGIAITNNYELKAINARKRVYNLSIIERFRDYFPSLTIAYMNTQTVSKRETDSRSQKFRIDSDIVIYDGGKRKLAYDISKLKAILARNDYRIALNRLIAHVLGAYLQILQYKGTIEIHKKTLERGIMQLGFIKKELELGEATRLQVMEIEAKVKEIELELEKTINNYALSLNSFKLLLKLNWRHSIDLLGDIGKDFILRPLNMNSDVDNFIAIAVKNRKEIESSEVELLINKKSYIINKLYFFPKFSIGLNYSLSDDQALPHQFIPREKGWGINFKVTSAFFGNTANIESGYESSENSNTRTFANSGTLGIMDSMDYKRKIVESKIELNTALEKRKEVKQQISIEVLSSVMAITNSWKMIEIAKKQLELYDRFLIIERLKANLGESTRYELMKKEIDRGEAAISYLESKVQYLQTSSALELSMGVDIGFLKLSKIRNLKQ